ncbi:MAG TPA: UBP-type zinc finger domain-containing protein [Actinomycetota bacterium]|nr:UBP-type zinc finger domain-containing protein [Actinomycetota bacterium]
MTDVCDHLIDVSVPEPTTPNGCEECLAMGSRWVHLRECLTCGHVGCCDASPNRHATKHWESSHHAAIKSLEPGEDWGYCYVDDLFVEEL